MKKWKTCLGAAFLFGVLVLFAGCGQNADADAVVQVGKEKLYLPEFMYYVYQAEKDGQVYEEMYQNIFSESYWDAEYGEGKTFRETAKEDAYENGIMYAIFEKEGKQAGYALSEEEEAECEKEATEEYASLSEKQREAIGLERDAFIAMKKKVTLGNKYYDALMDGLEIDEDKATSLIFPEEYVECEVEYLYAATKKVLEPYLERALAGEDFAAMAEEKPEELEEGSLGFVEGDFLLGESFEKEALKLANGEICSHLVKEEDGYYIIRMVDDSSTKSYEAACEEAILKARNEAFQAAYEKIKEGYEIKKFDSAWDSLTLGELTIE